MYGTDAGDFSFLKHIKGLRNLFRQTFAPSDYPGLHFESAIPSNEFHNCLSRLPESSFPTYAYSAAKPFRYYLLWILLRLSARIHPVSTRITAALTKLMVKKII